MGEDSYREGSPLRDWTLVAIPTCIAVPTTYCQSHNASYTMRWWCHNKLVMSQYSRYLATPTHVNNIAHEQCYLLLWLIILAPHALAPSYETLYIDICSNFPYCLIVTPTISRVYKERYKQHQIPPVWGRGSQPRGAAGVIPFKSLLLEAWDKVPYRTRSKRISSTADPFPGPTENKQDLCRQEYP